MIEFLQGFAAAGLIGCGIFLLSQSNYSSHYSDFCGSTGTFLALTGVIATVVKVVSLIRGY